MTRQTRHARLSGLLAATALTAAALCAAPAAHATNPRQNVIIFVTDGLRALKVDPILAPNLYAMKTNGVWFQNSHSMFPTFTTANAASMATSHYLGDNGDFSNTIYSGFPEVYANGTVTPFLENDQVLSDVDDKFAGTVVSPFSNVIPVGYLDAQTVLAAARTNQIQTATVGKVGPSAIFDHANSPLVAAAQRDTLGTPTIFVDDATGSTAGIPLDPSFAAALTAAGLPTVTPSRGLNGTSGNNVTPGTNVANTVQQQYFADVTTKVLLPQFKAAGKQFIMVFWSRDPDGTQHNQGDSLNTITPGINGPTSDAAVQNVDANLGQIMAALKTLGLDTNTDVLVAADHGFSTISKNSGPGFTQSATSYAATQTYVTYRNGTTVPPVQEVQTGYLPAGFLAIDLAHSLNLPLFDPDSVPATAVVKGPVNYPPVDPTQAPAVDGTRLQRPKSGDGVIGLDPTNPDVVVAANGGSDLIYLPNPASAATLAPQIVDFLTKQDYISGIFADDKFGKIGGALPLSKINFEGQALTPIPAIAVNFASYDTTASGCTAGDPTLCTAEIADSGLQQGQGMHGSFSRADTYNFMAAIGPVFKAGYVDTAPAGNVDVAATAAKILGLTLSSNGTLKGRALLESLAGNPDTTSHSVVMQSSAAANGVRTYLDIQKVGSHLYFDAAGFAGKTVGLTTK